VNETVNRGPLKDITVVELGHLIAGPFCGQLLGDMGADVIKVEPPETGDPMREWGRGEFPLWWEIAARNKKSVTADLRQSEGQGLVRQLLAKADILVENFRPGTLEKWGLGPEDLHAINPGLIIVRVSGYGQTGPYSTRAGFGGIGEAMGGWRHIVGYPHLPPARVGVSIGDTLAATYGCLGALAALHHRSLTGEGQVVDSALYEAVLQVMESIIPEYAIAGYERERTGSVLPSVAPSNVYPCKDGDLLIGANQDNVFRRLCAAMEEPELAEHPDYATHVARGRNMEALDERIGQWTSAHSVAELEEIMNIHGIPAGRIFRAVDMLEDPHFAAREAIVTLDHPRWGEFPMQNVFPRLSATPGSVRSLAPARPGEHNQLVYGELLSLEPDELASLASAGVI
jgi:formyl-CoA transferase